MAQEAHPVRTERTLILRVHPSPADPSGGPGAGTSRRDFLRLTMLGALGATSLGGGAGALAYLWPRGMERRLVAPYTLDDIKNGEVLLVRAGKFWLSRYHEARLGKDVLLALSWKCKHRGCAVPWKADESFGDEEGVFHCPCHESIFLRTGQNVAGPAPLPLDILAITLNGRKILVDTGKPIARERYETKQCTVIPA